MSASGGTMKKILAEDVATLLNSVIAALKA